MELPADLRAVLTGTLASIPARELTLAVDALVARYRGGEPADRPILADPVKVMAYAAYRMPATYAAVRSVLAQVVRAAASLAPASLLDLGGGTGAAAWAVTNVFPDLSAVTVLDQAPPALTVGRRLAQAAAAPALRDAVWLRADLGAAELPRVDLVTVSYVLGELTAAEREAVTARAAEAAARLVVIVEPGTPAGYRRVIDARGQLLAAGMNVLAPCPHEQPCPIASGRDWCHFAARVPRTSLHRQVKRAELGYEDEKFSYVAAMHGPLARSGLPPARVLRRPGYAKGAVTLTVCTQRDGVTRRIVARRHGERYRSARDVGWGDTWEDGCEDA